MSWSVGCYAVEVQSGWYPGALPAALCGLLREAGHWYEVKDDVVGECEHIDDYPAIAGIWLCPVQAGAAWRRG